MAALSLAQHAPYGRRSAEPLGTDGAGFVTDLDQQIRRPLDERRRARYEDPRTPLRFGSDHHQHLGVDAPSEAAPGPRRIARECLLDDEATTVRQRRQLVAVDDVVSGAHRE